MFQLEQSGVYASYFQVQYYKKTTATDFYLFCQQSL